VVIDCLDTLGVLARTLGEHFRPIAVECLQLGLSLVNSTTDPDIRRCMLVFSYKWYCSNAHTHNTHAFIWTDLTWPKLTRPGL